MSTPIIADRSRGKGSIQSWGIDSTRNGNARLWFSVAGTLLAPPNTFADGDFAEQPEPWQTTVSMTLVEGKCGWIFETLQKLLGEDDIDLERLDPEHEEGYDLQGTEVTVLFKHSEWDGRTRVEAGFLFPRPPAKLSRFGAELMAFRQQQMADK